MKRVRDEEREGDASEIVRSPSSPPDRVGATVPLLARLDAMARAAGFGTVPLGLHPGQSEIEVDEINNRQERPMGDGYLHDADTLRILPGQVGLAPLNPAFMEENEARHRILEQNEGIQFLELWAGGSERNLAKLFDKPALERLLDEQHNNRERVRAQMETQKKTREGLTKDREEIVKVAQTMEAVEARLHQSILLPAQSLLYGDARLGQWMRIMGDRDHFQGLLYPFWMRYQYRFLVENETAILRRPMEPAMTKWMQTLVSFEVTYFFKDDLTHFVDPDDARRIRALMDSKFATKAADTEAASREYQYYFLRYIWLRDVAATDSFFIGGKMRPTPRQWNDEVLFTHLRRMLSYVPMIDRAAVDSYFRGNDKGLFLLDGGVTHAPLGYMKPEKLNELLSAFSWGDADSFSAAGLGANPLLGQSPFRATADCTCPSLSRIVDISALGESWVNEFKARLEPKVDFSAAVGMASFPNVSGAAVTSMAVNEAWYIIQNTICLQAKQGESKHKFGAEHRKVVVLAYARAPNWQEYDWRCSVLERITSPVLVERVLDYLFGQVWEPPSDTAGLPLLPTVEQLRQPGNSLMRAGNLDIGTLWQALHANRPAVQQPGRLTLLHGNNPVQITLLGGGWAAAGSNDPLRWLKRGEWVKKWDAFSLEDREKISSEPIEGRNPLLTNVLLLPNLIGPALAGQSIDLLVQWFVRHAISYHDDDGTLVKQAPFLLRTPPLAGAGTGPSLDNEVASVMSTALATTHLEATFPPEHSGLDEHARTIVPAKNLTADVLSPESASPLIARLSDLWHTEFTELTDLPVLLQLHVAMAGDPVASKQRRTRAKDMRQAVVDIERQIQSIQKEAAEFAARSAGGLPDQSQIEAGLQRGFIPSASDFSSPHLFGHLHLTPFAKTALAELRSTAKLLGYPQVSLEELTSAKFDELRLAAARFCQAYGLRTNILFPSQYNTNAQRHEAPAIWSDACNKLRLAREEHAQTASKADIDEARRDKRPGRGAPGGAVRPVGMIPII